MRVALVATCLSLACAAADFPVAPGTKNAVHLTIVSASGLKRNANAFDVQSVVTLDDLFQA